MAHWVNGILESKRERHIIIGRAERIIEVIHQPQSLYEICLSFRLPVRSILGVSMATFTQPTLNKYWTYALWLALFTIFYNLAEGLISIFFGLSDETLTLFGFGVDSFIEVMSGAGILAMVLRIRQNPEMPRSQFERTALRVTGTSFYLLALGLGITAIYNLF